MHPASIAVEGVTKRFTDTPVLREVSLEVEPGSIVSLLGPSGCGKTTLLRIIAGLERPDTGLVRVGEEVLTGPGKFIPPERRRIGMVFQDWALFPHLTVAENVGYGVARGEDPKRVAETLAMVGLQTHHDRLPATLSGGQQQRVALARALAPQPRCLLLDEPFSNLDTALRVQVRSEVHQLLAELGITSIFVTHDQSEAFVLGDRVAVMADGVIVQHGTPTELYEQPVSPWVASFVGEANLLSGRAEGPAAATAIGEVTLLAPARGPVSVLARPEALQVQVGDSATIELVEYYGHDTLYVVGLDNGGGTVRVRSGAGPKWRRGDRVGVSHDGRPLVAWPA